MIGLRWFFAAWSLGFFRLCFGGESSSATTTNNADRRIANDSGIVVSAEGSNVSVSSSDPATVARALDSVDLAGANSAQGFTQLLDAADKLWNRGENLIGRTQQAVADAYTQAQETKQGTIDNKTLIVLAVAGAAALVALKK